MITFTRPPKKGWDSWKKSKRGVSHGRNHSAPFDKEASGFQRTRRAQIPGWSGRAGLSRTLHLQNKKGVLVVSAKARLWGDWWKLRCHLGLIRARVESTFARNVPSQDWGLVMVCLLNEWRIITTHIFTFYSLIYSTNIYVKKYSCLRQKVPRTWAARLTPGPDAFLYLSSPMPAYWWWRNWEGWGS